MLILDKEEYCKNILSEKDRKITKMDISLLAQYFDYKEMDARKHLREYIVSNTHSYNERLYDMYIDTAICNAIENPFRKERCIEVSQNEINKILELKDFQYKKIMMAMLLLGKFYKYCLHGDETPHDYEGLYCKSSFKDLKQIAKTSITKKEMREVLHGLYLAGYIKPLPLGGWKILIEDDGAYMNETSYRIKPDKDMICFLYNFHRNMTASVHECVVCHRWFMVAKRKKNNPFMYCDDCRKK